MVQSLLSYWTMGRMHGVLCCVAFLGLAGCGRLAYSGSGDDVEGAEDEAPGEDTAIGPQSPVDIAPDRFVPGPTVELSSASGGSNPQATWTGDQVTAVWSDNRLPGTGANAYFAATTTGQPVVTDRQLTADVGWVFPNIAWGAASHGFVWSDESEGATQVFFGSLDSTGAKQGNDIQLSSEPGVSPSIHWTGSQFAVAYADDAADPAFHVVTLTADGNERGRAQIDSSYIAGTSPRIAGGQGSLGLAWFGYPPPAPSTAQVQFSVLTENGMSASPAIFLSDPSTRADYPDVAWSGSEYAVVFSQEWTSGGVESDIFLQRISADGARIGLPEKVSDTRAARSPRVLWTGVGYLVAWLDFETNQVHFTSLEPDGTLIGPSVRATANEHEVQTFSAVWTGQALAVVWQNGPFEGDHRILSRWLTLPE